MATLNLTISDAALKILTIYAQRTQRTIDEIVESKGADQAIREAYIYAVQQLASANKIPDSVVERARSSFAASWAAISTEFENSRFVDADIATALEALDG